MRNGNGTSDNGGSRSDSHRVAIATAAVAVQAARVGAHKQEGAMANTHTNTQTMGPIRVRVGACKQEGRGEHRRISRPARATGPV
jgi:hypothetical protein